MDSPAIENQKKVQLVALEAQRAALMAAMDLHVRRSEELAALIEAIDEELIPLHLQEAL